MTEKQYTAIRHRRYYLPKALAAARRKLAALEAEAKREGIDTCQAEETSV